MTDHLYIVQLEKQYVQYLKNIILGISFQPIILRGGKNKPVTTAALHEQIRWFQSKEKKQNKKGWIIEWEEWASKKLGRQQWPLTVSVSTEEDFLFLIEKEKHVAAFKAQLHRLLQWNAAIKEWLAERPKFVLELNKSWSGICSVVDYLLNNDVSHHYLRSIPVPVHTKFIEQHKKVIHSILHHLNDVKFSSPDIPLEETLKLNRKPFFFTLRWLDEGLGLRYTVGMNLFAVPAHFLQQCEWIVERVILVENETNLYLFNKMPGTLAICSFGRALHLLKEIPFLHNTQLYYWGDVDEKGFEMLNEIREYYPHIISLFMDEATIVNHKTELDIKPIAYQKKKFLLLQPHEEEGYHLLLQNNQWLEQEKLQQEYVQMILDELTKNGVTAKGHDTI